MLSQKSKKILVCILYINLLLEYWVHGIVGFFNIILPISIIFMYFFYFSILEDLIRRYNLQDHHVLLIGFIFKMVQETFNTGSPFNEPFFFGVNLFNIFMANVLWWGILQSVFGLYFANGKIDDTLEEGTMGWLGWTLAIGFHVVFLLGSIFEGNLQQRPLIGIFICIALMIVASIMLILLLIIKKPQEKPIIERNPFIDKLLRFQVIISLLMGTVLIFIIGILALYLFILWSIFTRIVYTVQYRKGNRFIGRIKENGKL